MKKVTVLPHEKICPKGAEFDLAEEDSVLEGALKAGIDIEHACEMACACTTCHVIVRKGFKSLKPATETEEDLLDKAWGLRPTSRLSCQIHISDEDLEIELPKYTLNQVSEQH